MTVELFFSQDILRLRDLISSLKLIERTAGKDRQMAKKPNYGFEKRQKEIAKKAKKEEKAKRRQEEKALESPEEENESGV